MASEQLLVERVLINLHPDILAQAPFWDKPRSLKGLCQVVGFIEDKIAVVPERQRMEGIWHSSGDVTYDSQTVSPVQKGRRRNVGSVVGWDTLRKMPPEECIFGKRAIAQRRVGPQQFVLSGLPKVTAATSFVSLWVTLELKTGNVPALADTRAQFSCVRSVVIEFLYMGEKRCTFSSFSVSCFLTNEQRCEVTNAVKINIKSSLLSWDHEFKILKGCPFPPILGLDFHNRTKMLVHVDARKFAFGFARIIVIHFPSI